MEAGPGITIFHLRDKYRRELYLLCNLNKHAINSYGIATGRNVKTHLSTVHTYWPQLSKCVAEAKMGTRSFLSQASPPLLGFPLESGLDGLSYYHYFRVTYGPLSTIKCYGHIPGFTQPPRSFWEWPNQTVWSEIVWPYFPDPSWCVLYEKSQKSHVWSPAFTLRLFISFPQQCTLQRDILLSFLAILTCTPYPNINYFSPGL